jgi:hypothetical protein
MPNSNSPQGAHFYLGFFVASLAELKGTRKRRLSNKKNIE